MKVNPYGKNNFDRLAAAGLVAGEGDGDSIRVKTEARVAELNTVIAKVGKVQAFLGELYVLPKPRQLKRLAQAAQGLKELHASKLPVGAKKHIATCLNEVTSLREGVYSSATKLDRQTLALTSSMQAKSELQAMVESAQHRMERIEADTLSGRDLDEFYRKAGDVIKKHDSESTKLASIMGKPYALIRVPVVPIDGGLSAEKLARLGFKADFIPPTYPVIHNQLVLGINPKMLASHDSTQASRFAELQQTLHKSGVDLNQIKKLHGKAKDIAGDIAKLDPEKADPEYKKKLETQLADVENQAMKLIEKSGVDPDEYNRLAGQIKRSHNAQPAAVKEEAKRLIKLFEKKMKVHLREVSSNQFSKNGAVWFWLMPDRELDMLAKASNAKRVNVTRWGFAFN